MADSVTIFTKQDIEAAAKAYFEAPKYRDGDKGFRAMTAALTAAEASMKARGAMTQGKHEAHGDSGSGITLFYSMEFWKGEFDFALIRLDKED